jgi:hypothetical protein
MPAIALLSEEREGTRSGWPRVSGNDVNRGELQFLLVKIIPKLPRILISEMQAIIYELPFIIRVSQRENDPVIHVAGGSYVEGTLREGVNGVGLGEFGHGVTLTEVSTFHVR